MTLLSRNESFGQSFINTWCFILLGSSWRLVNWKEILSTGRDFGRGTGCWQCGIQIQWCSYEVMHFHFLQHLKWRAFSAGTSRWTNHKTTQWVLIEIFSVSYSLELDSDSLYGHLNFFWILLACGFFRFLFLCRLGTMPPEEVQTCHMI